LLHLLYLYSQFAFVLLMTLKLLWHNSLNHTGNTMVNWDHL